MQATANFVTSLTMHRQIPRSHVAVTVRISICLREWRLEVAGEVHDAPDVPRRFRACDCDFLGPACRGSWVEGRGPLGLALRRVSLYSSCCCSRTSNMQASGFAFVCDERSLWWARSLDVRPAQHLAILASATGLELATTGS